ncbi:hypothetical protein B0T26DRAFT_640112 [Lasiosphaeria miniovina]|uniref:Chaperone-binding protein n=1 Tax=Lasiosphaeria miniovina TaxID=1954250 RepID=A0AA40E4Z2_9PEZI|nr:uncharacterized protein B0T26DRAFT_640112 [Lasiosphaeria miniovina]KAK0728389.1 hypothetical protein B0T26DRAFT_640112 [Lasiosphaeria miniovina]
MWEDFEFDAERIPTLKLGFHLAQILFAFVLWALEIAVFKDKDSTINGNNGWTFAAFFLSIPAWIFLTMAPRSPRTRKLAEPHAMLAIDALFTVIWLSAFATQASFNTANSCGGACSLSKAIVGLGFFVFLFFAVTTFLSIWTLKYYQMHNQLPGYERRSLHGHSEIDPDKAAFSMAPHDDEAYAPINVADHDDPHPLRHHPSGSMSGGARSDYAADPYGAPSPYAAPAIPPAAVDPYATAPGVVAGGLGRHPSPLQNPFMQDNPFDSDLDYHGSTVSGHSAAVGGRYAAPTAHDTYEDDHGPAQFPNADYERIERR